MDLPATQACEDDFLPTQPVFHSTLHETKQEVVEIGMLCFDSKTYVIKTGLTTIGRHPDCVININDQTVSKNHAEIEVNNHDTTAWICDLNSSNKTKLNNTILRPGRCYELKHEAVLRFGMVCATYKVLRNMDESFIHETSMSRLQAEHKMVIPGTPDSSANDSSSFGRNSSIIPATQGENRKSVFQVPTLPPRISMDNACKSALQDTSADCSIEKENVNGKQISIHDLETQKPIETNNESATDIHDIETQKICLSTINAPPLGTPLKNHEENVNGTDMQLEDKGDIHKAITPKKVDNRTSGIAKSLETIQMLENKNEKHETTDGKSEINGTIKAGCSNETSESRDNSKHIQEIVEDPQSDSQKYLKLQSRTSLGDETLKHDTSRSRSVSVDLLENIVSDDEVLNVSVSESPTRITIVRAHSDNDSHGKNTDDENIFEAATQITNTGENAFHRVTERVKYPFKASLLTDDSNETNNEFVLQKYSRINSQDSELAKNSDSDSATDEEGHFMEIALREKNSPSCSFETLRQKHLNVKTNATSSTDSEDMFDTLTQPFNAKEKNVEIKEKSVAVEEESSENIDYEMAPTQLISEIEKTKYETSNKANLNDTVEKNLNKMFNEESGQDIQEQPHMSTQTLENMLQTQHENNTPVKNQEVKVECVSPDILPQKSRKRRKTGTSSVFLSSTPLSNGGEESAVINGDTNADSQNSENYFSALTSVRKRNIITDSQDTSDVTQQKLNTVTEKEQVTTNITNNVDHESSTNCDTALETKISSTPTSEPNTLSIKQSSRTSEDEEENVKLSEPMNSNNQCSTIADGEEHSKISKLLEDDDEDIMAGLPEVHISGTISNPPSPSSSISEYRINMNNKRSKQIPIMIAPKSKKAPQKSRARRNKVDAEPYRSASNLNSSTILGNAYNFLSSDLGVGKTTIIEDDEEVNKKSKGSTRRTRAKNPRSSQKNDCVTETELTNSIHLQTKMRQSPCIRRNRRARSSSKENVDRSFIFQVGNGVSVDKTTDEPVRKSASGTSRVGKRLRSIADTLETSNVKKRKEEVVANTEKRITGTRRQSANNILNYMNARNSPITVNESGNVKVAPNQKKISKELVIKLVRVTPFTPTGSVSPCLPAETVSENKKLDNNEVNRNDVANQTNSNMLGTENNIAGKTVTRRRANQATTSAVKHKVIDFTSEVGEESQEVEMIMSGTLKWEKIRKNKTLPDVETKATVNENSKGVIIRKSRKRGNTNVIADLKNTERNTDSEISDSDTSQCDTLASNAKRARVSKNTSSVPSTAVEKPVSSANTKSKATARSTRTQQSSNTESSTEEGARNDINQSNLETTINTTTKAAKGRSRKKENTKVTKEQDKGNNDSTFSDTSSSIDTAVMPAAPSRTRRNTTKSAKGRSKKKEDDTVVKEQSKGNNDSNVSETNSNIDTSEMPVTPSRTRRNISSLSIISSPYKMKHKILFTGIPGTEYSKLLTKLNAVQVEDPAKCTVLVTDKVRRTLKFLCALALSVPIVSIDWLIASKKAGNFVNLEDYILKDPTAESKFGFKLRDSLKKSSERKLLEGYTIVLTPNIIAPPIPELKSMINSCGGKPLIRPPSSWPQKAVIVSHEDTLGNARQLLAKASKDVTIQSIEFILTGILRQELNFTEFKLS